MKLYISYYGNYVTIVEGIYNSKKQNYDIKNVNIILKNYFRQLVIQNNCGNLRDYAVLRH